MNLKRMPRLAALPLALCLASAGCGYHISSATAPAAPATPAPAAGAPATPAATAQLGAIPKSVHTIAVEPFHNSTQRPDLARLLSADLTREFISRTHLKVVSDPKQADAVITGAITNFVSYATTADPVSGRSTGAQIILQLNIYFTERANNKPIFQRNAYEFRERYEISENVATYFDESGTAIQRVTRDAATSILTAILESF